MISQAVVGSKRQAVHMTDHMTVHMPFSPAQQAGQALLIYQQHQTFQDPFWCLLPGMTCAELYRFV